MAQSTHDASDRDTLYVVVTGANGYVTDRMVTGNIDSMIQWSWIRDVYTTDILLLLHSTSFSASASRCYNA
jgi:hypothetical protein